MTRRYPLLVWFLTLSTTFVLDSSLFGADWLHWRGPEQSGVSREKNLPDEWDPRTVGKNNLIWKQPYGCRSTPLIMNGKVYIINAYGETPGVPTQKEKMLIGERVMCLDAKTGKVLWEKVFNVFHSDIVTNRLGWAPLAADPVHKYVYAHSTGGFLFCFHADSGEIVWQHSLTEEYGRVTGYGGRVGGGPIFDSGLVILGIVNSSWGDQGVGASRMVAFDGKSGKLVWWATCPGPLKGTYYSNPVVHVINGERLLITGGADGGIHAFQVRTGKLVWTYPFAVGVINPAPVVDGNFVYAAHGEENLDSGEVGRVICLDASKIKDGKPTKVWDYMKGIRFGLSSPAFANGNLYVLDDSAKLYCFEGKKGKLLWKLNCGTVARGAPVVADGKVYVSETNARFHIIKLPADGSKPDDNMDVHTTKFRLAKGSEGFVESHCSPSVADARVYLASRDEIYCIGLKDAAVQSDAIPKQNEETNGDTTIAQLQIFPADIVIAPGETAEFELKAYTAKGQLIKDAKVNTTWSLGEPPLPKGAKTAPPKLDATIDMMTGKIVVNPKKLSQQGYVDVTDGKLKARARVRVAPQLPYKQDFEMVPEGAVPSGWVNTQGKYRVVELMENGKTNKALFKVNDNPRPPIARANAYISLPNATGYTIAADVKGTDVRGILPDMGIIGNRYTLYLDGKTNENGNREIKVLTWEALTPRPEGRVQASKDFNWKPDVWYRVKLSVEIGEKEGIIKGKVWERGQDEPKEWTLTLTDPRPNREGAAALYGYITNATNPDKRSEIYYDNIEISLNIN